MTSCISPIKESKLMQALNVSVTPSPDKKHFPEKDAEHLDCNDEIRDVSGHVIYRPAPKAAHEASFEKMVEQWKAWQQNSRDKHLLLNLGARAFIFRKRAESGDKLDLTASLDLDSSGKPTKACSYESSGTVLCREIRGAQQELTATDPKGRVEVSLLNNPGPNPDFLVDTFYPKGSSGDTVRLTVKKPGEIRGKTARSNFVEKGTQYHLVAHQGLSAEGKPLVIAGEKIFSVSLDFTRTDRTLIRFQTDTFTYEYTAIEPDDSATLTRTHNETMQTENLDPALVETALSTQFAFLMGYLANTNLMRKSPDRDMDIFFELVTAPQQAY